MKIVSQMKLCLTHLKHDLYVLT